MTITHPEDLDDLRAMIERRATEAHRWAPGHAATLLDLGTAPNPYLWHLAHDIPVLPGLDLFTAICALFPGFSFGEPTTPAYRRWRDVPSAWMIARAIDYALNPPKIEQVEVRALRDGDLVIRGPHPFRWRHRVHGHHTTEESTSFFLVPVTFPIDGSHVQEHPTHLLRRERPFDLRLSPGVWWDGPPTTHSRGIAHRLVELHPTPGNADRDQVGEFARGQLSPTTILNISRTERTCRHGLPLHTVEYQYRSASDIAPDAIE